MAKETPAWKDPVVEEVRAIRDSYAKRFDYDIDAMVRDLKAQEAASGRARIVAAPRKAEIVKPDRKTPNRS